MNDRDEALRTIQHLGPPEPYRIKMVEPIHASTPAERERWLEEAGYNLFRLPAERVFLDLLTDSGTGAMSQHQWSALLQGDESYAGARSYYRFHDAVSEIFGLPHLVPTHQGRAAEFLLFSQIVRPGQKLVANTFFDTTRANAEISGATIVDLPTPDARQPSALAPFKGNIDLIHLADLLETSPRREIAGVVLTVTNNAGGGQPVSLANIREAHHLCCRHEVPLIVDACRIAENAFFIKEREDDYANASIPEIVRAVGDCADAITMSAKKDGLANIGGFLAVRDAQLAERIRQRMVVTEGFPTYGGLAGRDLEAIAVGLREALDENYLAHRIGQVRFLAGLLRGLGIPIVEPPGGHGVFVDAGAFLGHLPRELFPGQALAIALYLEAGIRSCEIGSVMFGNGPNRPAHDFVRLAIPRRVYTNTQLAVVAQAFASLQERRTTIPGVYIVEQSPVLRHFTARFAFAKGDDAASRANAVLA